LERCLSIVLARVKKRTSQRKVKKLKKTRYGVAPTKRKQKVGGGGRREKEGTRGRIVYPHSQTKTILVNEKMKTVERAALSAQETARLLQAQKKRLGWWNIQEVGKFNIT